MSLTFQAWFMTQINRMMVDQQQTLFSVNLEIAGWHVNGFTEEGIDTGNTIMR